MTEDDEASITSQVLIHGAPIFVTVAAVAELLPTSRRAMDVSLERHQRPGVTQIGRRVLFRSADLLDWLDQKRASSTEE